MRFQVPQFVDIEDKVIGPLTLKQFAFYLVAVLALVALYPLVDLGLLITVAIPLLGAAAAFAHAKFYGQSFGAVLFNALGFYTTRRLWLWRRVPSDGLLIIGGREYEEVASVVTQQPASALSLVSQTLATQGNVSSEDAVDPFVEDGHKIEAAPVSAKATAGTQSSDGARAAKNTKTSTNPTPTPDE